MPERSTLVLASLLPTLALAACESPGTLRLTARTSGDTLDPDGYTVRLADADSASGRADAAGARDTTFALAAEGSVAVGDLSAGAYRVRLEGVARNCALQGPDPRDVTITAGDTASTTFEVTCEPALLDRIVFVSERDGDPPDVNQELYAVAPDGGGLARLTHSEEGYTLDRDWMPLVSPQGLRVAFVSMRDGNEEIYVVRADGSGPTRLSRGGGMDRNPSFSPDGETVYYWGMRNRPDVLGNEPHLFRVSASGGEPTRIGQDVPSPSVPVVSPDGETVLLESSRGSSSGTALVATDPDGSNVRELSPDTLGASDAAWSPDGSWIVFRAERDGDADLYVMEADGSDVTPLTDHPASDGTHPWGGPVVSPDGQRIAFVSDRDGNREIYVVAPDGTDLTRVTRSEGTDSYPTFSPDGQRIAFASERDGNLEIYTIGVDGNGLTRITDHPAADTDPDWAPGR